MSRLSLAGLLVRGVNSDSVRLKAIVPALLLMLVLGQMWTWDCGVRCNAMQKVSHSCGMKGMAHCPGEGTQAADSETICASSHCDGARTGQVGGNVLEQWQDASSYAGKRSSAALSVGHSLRLASVDSSRSRFSAARSTVATLPLDPLNSILRV